MGSGSRLAGIRRRSFWGCLRRCKGLLANSAIHQAAHLAEEFGGDTDVAGYLGLGDALGNGGVTEACQRDWRVVRDSWRRRRKKRSKRGMRSRSSVLA